MKGSFMDPVGESTRRNEVFKRHWTREKIVKTLVSGERPVVFDVGAHKGESVLFFRAIFPTARIHSFEANPATYRALSELTDADTAAYNLGASDFDGEAVFYRNAVSHTCSLHKVNMRSADSIRLNQARAEGASGYEAEYNREITVAVKRLDTVCAERNIPKVDLLKIDVQAGEAAVLRGMGRRLFDTGVVMLEISFFDYYEHKSSIMDVERELLPAGFELYAIGDISHNPMNGRTDWAEFIYLNRNAR